MLVEQEDMLVEVEDRLLQGSQVVDNHRVVVVHNQQKEGLAAQCVTSAEPGEQPSRVGVQTCHRAYPFQSCAESACKHTPCSTHIQLNKIATEKPH